MIEVSTASCMDVIPSLASNIEAEFTRLYLLVKVQFEWIEGLFDIQVHWVV